jgi:hypothetical protein
MNLLFSVLSSNVTYTRLETWYRGHRYTIAALTCVVKRLTFFDFFYINSATWLLAKSL